MGQQPRLLTFDEPTHIYRLDGERLLSVTQVLTLAGRVQAQYFTEFGRTLGTAVHKAVWMEIMGDLHYDSLHPLVKIRMDAWLRFRSECRYVPALELCEKPMYHQDELYALKPDTPGWINNRPVMQDVKNGDASTARWQTAGYAEATPVVEFFGKVPDRFDIRLRPDGKYRLNQHKDPNDYLVFIDDLHRVRGW